MEFIQLRKYCIKYEVEIVQHNTHKIYLQWRFS